MKTFAKMIVIISGLFLFTFSQDQGQWKKIQTFTGSGIESTDDFYIKAKKWRVVWKASETYSGAGLFFSGFIKCDDGCGSLGKLFGNIVEPDNGVSVFRTRGSHYIEINSSNCDWNIEIQEYVNIK